MNDRIKNISFAAMAGATIAAASFIGNVVLLGKIWDQILIPLIFLGFKQKRKTMPLIWPTIIACILLMGYKFYLGFFIFAYYMIAEAVFWLNGQVSLKSIVIVAFVYVIGYFGAWVIISYYIHNMNFADIIYQITSAKFQNKTTITLILIFEPLIFSFCYLQLFDLVKRAKIFND